MLHFDRATGMGHDDDFEISSATYRLMKSACFQKSGAALTCTVTMDTAKSVTAQFDEIGTHSLSVQSPFGNGAGTVTSDLGGIDCGTTCTHTYYNGTDVTLTAAPDTDTSAFDHFEGDCNTTNTTCIVSIASGQLDKTVKAYFALLKRHLTVNKTGTGTGTVSSDFQKAGDPGENVQIFCGTGCTGAAGAEADYDHGDVVTLKAAPSTGVTNPPALFAGWSGACTTTGRSFGNGLVSLHEPSGDSTRPRVVARSPWATAQGLVSSHGALG